MFRSAFSSVRCHIRSRRRGILRIFIAAALTAAVMLAAASCSLSDAEGDGFPAYLRFPFTAEVNCRSSDGAASSSIWGRGFTFTVKMTAPGEGQITFTAPQTVAGMEITASRPEAESTDTAYGGETASQPMQLQSEYRLSFGGADLPLSAPNGIACAQKLFAAFSLDSGMMTDSGAEQVSGADVRFGVFETASDGASPLSVTVYTDAATGKPLMMRMTFSDMTVEMNISSFEQAAEGTKSAA